MWRMRSIVTVMDGTLANLATSTATTLVGLMATDAWTQTKQVASAIFKRRGQDADAILEELEGSNDLVWRCPAAEVDALRASQIAAWSTHLRLMLSTDPGLAHALQEINECTADITQLSSTVTMNAKATGQGRIYQQGSGLQINR